MKVRSFGVTATAMTFVMETFFLKSCTEVAETKQEFQFDEARMWLILDLAEENAG